MQRRRFRREFKVEAVKFVGERQVSVAQAGTTVRPLRRPHCRLSVL
jgi:transposase-like protein